MISVLITPSKRKIAAVLAILLICIQIGFSTLITQAQNETPIHGTDPISGVNYIELYRPEWQANHISLRPDGQVIAISETSEQVDLYSANLEPIGILVGHTNHVNAIDWTADGKKIATGSDDNTVRIWDAATRTSLMILQHTNPVIALAWSPDQNKLATIEEDINNYEMDSEGHVYTGDILRVWDIQAGGKPLFSANFSNSSYSVSWNPDSTQIATGADAINIWDAKTGQVSQIIPRAWSTVSSVAWSPDGTKIAYGDSGDEGALHLYDLTTEQDMNTIESLTSIASIVWNGDGTKLADGALDRTTIRITDLATDTKLYLSGYPDTVPSADWSQDGTILVGASQSGTIRVWDMMGLPDLSGIPTVTPQVPIYDLFDAKWSPNSQFVAVAGSWGVKVFDRNKQEIATLKSHKEGDTSVAWDATGQRLAVGGGAGDTTVWIWRFDQNTKTFTLKHALNSGNGGSIDGLFWSPNGESLASLRMEQAGSYIIGTVHIWDTRTGQLKRTVKSQSAFTANGLGWSSDSSKIIGLVGTEIYVANILSGEIEYVTKLDYFDDPNTLAVFNGQKIAAVGKNLYVYGLNPDYSFIPLVKLLQPNKRYGVLDWNSDGSRIAAVDKAGFIDIIDPFMGITLLSLTLPQRFNAMDWSPDNSQIAVVYPNGPVEFYDVSSLPSSVRTPTLTPIATPG